MSVRRLSISVRNAAERSKYLRDAMRRAARGDRAHQDSGLYFENVDELRRILTEKRLELLMAISRHRPASVRELAGLVERDYKNVNDDVTLLQRLGLVKLEAKRGRGRAQAPMVPYDQIQVTIDLHDQHQAHTGATWSRTNAS
jgi:predicted transcriptional regulator